MSTKNKPSDRIPPSLLDRLLFLSPEERLTGATAGITDEPREGDGRGRDHYRDGIVRDLKWLFNSTSPLGFTDPGDLKRFPNVATSVLNYGLRGIFGRVIEDLSDIEREVGEALARFEPRLIVQRQTLRASQEGQLVEIEIEATLLIQRASRRLWLRTDLETMVTDIKFESHG